LVPRSDEFEGQGQRSRSAGTKNALSAPVTPPAAHEWYALAANNVQQQRTALGGDFGGLHAVYVR